jgi:hypothetical protein
LIFGERLQDLGYKVARRAQLFGDFIYTNPSTSLGLSHHINGRSQGIFSGFCEHGFDFMQRS